MHLYINHELKICIFWSPRCGYKSLDRSFKKSNWKSISDQTHNWKKYKKEDIINYSQYLIFRDPWSRFKSFWRVEWLKNQLESNNIDIDISIDNFYNWYKDNKNNFVNTLIHHCSPQNSQASILINWKTIKCYHLKDIKKLINELNLINCCWDDGKFNINIQNEPPTWIFEMYKDDYEMINKILNLP